MFDELYRKTGILKVPAFYVDGRPRYTDYPCIYFRQEATVRDESGALQSVTQFYVKPSTYDFPETALAAAVIVDDTGRSWEVKRAERVFDHFANQFETLILTVA